MIKWGRNAPFSPKIYKKGKVFMKIYIEMDVSACKNCLMARLNREFGGEFFTCHLTGRYVPEEKISKHCPFKKENAEGDKNE